MTDTISNQLQRARARIARGWVQGSLFVIDELGSPPRCCLIGALMGDRAWALPSAAVLLLLHDVAWSGRPVTDSTEAWERLVDYNNAPDRTQADVLDLFDRALTRVTK